MMLLITGAGGQLGKEWADFCEEGEIAFMSYNSQELDVNNSKQVASILSETQPTAVINCAAYTNVDKAEDESEKATSINSTAVKSLACICKDLGIKLVHFSTDYVFNGSQKDQEQFPGGYLEDHSTNPINIYGKTKRDGEEAIIESECDFLIVRVSWLCGKYGKNFVKTMLRLSSERDELNVVNDQFGSPTFANQVVRQTFTLLKQEKSGIFHLSSSGITSRYEFAKEVFRIKEISSKINPVSSKEFKTKAKRPSFSKLSTQKISTIGEIKILSWQEGLTHLLHQITEHEVS